MNLLRPTPGWSYKVDRETRVITRLTRTRVYYRKPKGTKELSVRRISWACWVQERLSQLTIRDDEGNLQ